ncbi:hypothetical protein SO802_019475, partial [Lithocarpus litseifolius]
DDEPTCKCFRWLDGKTCKRGSEVAPLVLTRFSMYKNQARVAEEKEASYRETTAIEREKVAKRREEKARVRERIAKVMTKNK